MHERIKNKIIQKIVSTKLDRKCEIVSAKVKKGNIQDYQSLVFHAVEGYEIYNVETLVERNSGSLRERHRVNIVCIQETR